MSYTNLTDKDIVSTGRNEDDVVAVFRLPGVSISGYERDTLTDDGSDTTDETDTVVLTAPKNLALDSADPKVKSSGEIVVDAVVSFDSVEGATSYEVRVAKV